MLAIITKIAFGVGQGARGGKVNADLIAFKQNSEGHVISENLNIL